MSPEQLTAIAERLLDATENGTRHFEYDEDVQKVVSILTDKAADGDLVGNHVLAQHGDFIAHAPADIAALLAEVERLRAKLEDVQTEWEKLVADVSGCDKPPYLIVAERDAALAEVEKANEHLGWARAEVEMLRGIDCEADGDGPCGACIKCARAERDAAIVTAKAQAVTIAELEEQVEHLSQRIGGLT